MKKWNYKDRALDIFIVSKDLTKSWKKACKIADKVCKEKYPDMNIGTMLLEQEGFDWDNLYNHLGQSDLIIDLQLKLLQPTLMKENFYFLVWGFDKMPK
jgi:hypothetical protein